MHVMRAFILLFLALTIIAPASTRAPAWQVTGTQELSTEAELLLLSPDGTDLLEANLMNADQLCVQKISSNKETCAAVDAGAIARNSVTSSPDSTAITFMVDWATLGIDSDVLVFESDTGEIINLTDDDPERTGADQLGRDYYEPEVPIDLYPSWSPDSLELVFVRTIWGGDDDAGTSLMPIPRSGGEPTETARFPGKRPPLVNAPIHALEDGSFLLSTGPSPDQDTETGIFRVTPDGTIDLLVDGNPDDDTPEPTLVDVTTNGELVIFFIRQTPESDPGDPIAFILDTASGQRTPLDGQHNAAPIFAPDDRHILTITTDSDNSMTLSIVIPDRASTPLYGIPTMVHPTPGLAAMPLTSSMYWAESNTILAHVALNSVLLTLEPGSGTPLASPSL